MLLLPCVNYNLVCVYVLPHMTEVTVIKSGLKQLLLALFSLCIFLLRGSVGGTCVLEGVCVCVCVCVCTHIGMPACVYVLFSVVSVMRKQANPSNKKRGTNGHTQTHMQAHSY